MAFEFCEHCNGTGLVGDEEMAKRARTTGWFKWPSVTYAPSPEMADLDNVLWQLVEQHGVPKVMRALASRLVDVELHVAREGDLTRDTAIIARLIQTLRNAAATAEDCQLLQD